MGSALDGRVPRQLVAKGYVARDPRLRSVVKDSGVVTPAGPVNTNTRAPHTFHGCVTFLPRRLNLPRRLKRSGMSKQKLTSGSKRDLREQIKHLVESLEDASRANAQSYPPRTRRRPVR